MGDLHGEILEQLHVPDPIYDHALGIRGSPAVEGPQAKIRRYLASDGCKFRLGEAHVSSGEPRALFEFKLKVDEKRQTLTKFDEN
jgi:hypothetical protein